MEDFHVESFSLNRNQATTIMSKPTIQQHEEELVNKVSKPCFMASLNSPFEALASSSLPPSLFSCFSGKNKRVSEEDTMPKEAVVDRKHKRMIKNRESAARSRARRQAYTSELEREVAELLEENAKLRKQQLELLLAAPIPEGLSNKSTHTRSLSASF